MTYKVSVLLKTKDGKVTDKVQVASVDADEFVVGSVGDATDKRRPLFGPASGDVSFYCVDRHTFSPDERALIAYFPAGTDWIVERS